MTRGLDKFDELVACFEKLPGVGKKSALRYAYFVSLGNSFAGLNLAHCIEDAIKFLRRCDRCGALSEDEICAICADTQRDTRLLCVVESPKDVLILEKSGGFEGYYFVLDDINETILNKLVECINHNGTKEIVFALTPGLNSDGIMLYIEDKLQELPVSFSKIAQGIPTGVSLENVDLISLSKALLGRMKI